MRDVMLEMIQSDNTESTYLESIRCVIVPNLIYLYNVVRQMCC